MYLAFENMAIFWGIYMLDFRGLKTKIIETTN